MSLPRIDPAATQTRSLTDAQLDELSRDPRNRVFRADHEETREPWDMARAKPLFQSIHAAFTAHCLKHPDATEADDARVREQIEAGGTAELQRLIGDHPTLFAKLTDRKLVNDPSRAELMWFMIDLHMQVGAGSLTMKEAQQAFANRALTQLRQ